jgi:DNA polymerase (family 10)
MPQTRSTVDRSTVGRVLDQIASHLELRQDNPFRVRAFRTAARTVRGLPGEPADWVSQGTLEETRGIGPAIQAVVRDLVEGGRSSLLDELREHTPAGLVEMLDISGLGVTKVRTIHEKLGVDSLPGLEAAARDGRLASLPGFGARTAENVLRGIARVRQAVTFRLSHHAREEAELIRDALARVPGVARAIVAGEVRRALELVREIVIVLVVDRAPNEVLAALAQVPGVDEFGGHDERRATLRFAGGERAKVVVTPPANLGAVLIHATGSESHVAALQAWARERGYSLDGAALWRGSEFVPAGDEESVYGALGLAWVPPELREDAGEVARAASGLPRLIERGDVKGLIHCHSDYSDGNLSVRDLALACRDAGYHYVGITDHGGAAAYVGGLSDDELRRQWQEIDAANAEPAGIRMLKGIEADILPDGRLGYSDATLAGLDFVIASVHNRFLMSRDEMTARVLAVMDNPHVTILGHLTGRLLLAREPFPLDLDRVFARAAERGVAIEINADPQRLDLDWREARRARSAGVAISIGADAHSAAGLDNTDFGVRMARKAWLEAGDVLNTRTAEEFLAFAARRRGR